MRVRELFILFMLFSEATVANIAAEELLMPKFPSVYTEVKGYERLQAAEIERFLSIFGFNGSIDLYVKPNRYQTVQYYSSSGFFGYGEYKVWARPEVIRKVANSSCPLLTALLYQEDWGVFDFAGTYIRVTPRYSFFEGRVAICNGQEVKFR